MIPQVRRRPWLAATARLAWPRPNGRPGRSRRRPLAINLPLLTGTLIWLGLYLVAVYGPVLAPHDQFFAIGQLNGASPPYPPSAVFPLGSDELGHDVLSWLLIGVRPTLLLVIGAAALRLALALPLGLFAGWRAGSLADRGVSALAGALTALPAVVGAMLAVLAVGVSRGWAAFAVGLTAFGWAAPALIVRRVTLDVAGEGYVAAARSLGADEGWLVRRHVLPNVLPSALPTLVLQVAACLLLLAELGFLQLFLGGGLVMPFADGLRRVPAMAEWGGLLAQNQPLGLLYRAPWIVLAPVVAIALAAWGAAQLATGVSRAVRRRSLGQLLGSRRMLGMAAALLLLALPAQRSTVADPMDVAWARRFDGPQAAADLATLDGGTFGGREAGSTGAAAAASWLVGQLGALGWRPATGTDALRPVALPTLTAQGAPALDLRGAGKPARFGPPQVSALAVPWSAGGSASGPLLFVGRPGPFHPGQRYRPSSGADYAGKVVVLAPPTAAFPMKTMGVVLDAVANDGAAAAIILDTEPASAYAALGPPGATGPGSRRLPVIEAQGEAARALLAGSPVTPQNAAALADGPDFAPIPLRGSAEIASGFSAAPPTGTLVAMRLPDVAPSAPTLVVAAAYDRNGAAGDGSGAAVLLGLARLLATDPLPAEVLLLALPGGPPGDTALAMALASPPLANRPVALAVRIDDLGGGGPLALGAYAPDGRAVELAAQAARAANDVGAPVQTVQAALFNQTAGSVPTDGFHPVGGDALDGPAVAFAARSGENQPPDATALAAAGRAAALLLARAAHGNLR